MILTLKTELKKAFSGKLFFIALFISSAIAVAAGIVSVYIFKSGVAPYPDENPWLAVSTLYRYWICDDGTSVAPDIFYVLLPLTASLTFGWSYSYESRSGYVRNVLTRTKSIYYFISKYIAVFLAGSMTALIPLILNVITVGSFIPAVKPDAYYSYGYIRLAGTMFSRLYFTHPVLYLAAMIIQSSIFAGLFSLMSLTLSFFIKNRFAVTTVPFMLLLAANYLTGMFMENLSSIGELSPLKFLHAATGNIILLRNAVIEAIVLFAVTAAITLAKGTKKDVY